MKVKRNRRAPSVKDADAYVAKQDQVALVHELGLGVAPGLVSENGIVTPEDDRYHLLAGERDPQAILFGLVLWAPDSWDVVVATPSGNRVLVVQGPVLLDAELGGSQNGKLLVAAADSLRRAYDEDREVVSRWLLALAGSGVKGLLSHYGVDAVEPDWKQTFPSNSRSIWRELKSRGVNPWPGRPR